MKTVLPWSRIPLDDVADIAPPDGVDAVGRLVEHDQVGVVDERLRDAEPLPHALRVRADFLLLPLGHVDDVEQLVGTLAPDFASDAAERAEEVHDLPAVR